MTETPLDRIQRKVIEGAARIARQVALAAEIKRSGHNEIHNNAIILLETLQVTQRPSEEHLARELSKANSFKD